ncbi:MAG TPA: hypothetical protein VK691_05505 [Solirubrobacteraceae bacterium]|jgi:hypothetical protein|nr:hypothetical protein [Solirubrobacteraceae bacterium]
MNPKTPSDREQGGMVPNLLLALLIDAGSEGLDTEQVTREAKRDYHSDPERGEVVAALELLVERDLVLRDGERWRSTPATLTTPFSFQDVDALAAFVAHILVTEGREGMSADQVARECERDPADGAERQEVGLALDALADYQLAVRDEDDLWRPTRAAVQAARLSL